MDQNVLSKNCTLLLGFFFLFLASSYNWNINCNDIIFPPVLHVPAFQPFFATQMTVITFKNRIEWADVLAFGFETLQHDWRVFNFKGKFMHGSCSLVMGDGGVGCEKKSQIYMLKCRFVDAGLAMSRRDRRCARA